MKISSIDKDLKSILDGGYYQIPRFQRPYSWNNENITEFWKDVSSDENQEYFIGSMVVYKRKQSYFGVIDGQQRLTTITLLLCGIRDYFSSLDEEKMAIGIQQLIEKKNIDAESEYVLQTDTPYPYFHECIQSSDNDEAISPINKEEKNLKKSFELIKKLIEDSFDKCADEEKKIFFLKNLRDKILKIKVIFIEVDNEVDAYMIFETLNTRGMDLMTSDLVKNHFTRLLKKSNARVDRTLDKWNEILDTVQTASREISVDNFIYYYWQSKESSVPQKNIFKEFSKKINEKNAKQYLDSLCCESRFYRIISDPDYKDDWKNEESSLKESLEAIALFRVKQPTPVVLAIISEYFGGKISLSTAKKILSQIEKFHFIHNAITSQRSQTTTSSFYAKKARELREVSGKNSKGAVLKEIKEKLKESMPSQEEFTIAFKDLKYSKKYTKDKKVIQYVLKKFDQYWRQGECVDYSKMSIEHLSSQSDSVLSAEDVASIGNLVFVSSRYNNDSLENHSFSEKVALLRSNCPHLDKIILDANEWTSDKIAERRMNMAGLAYGKIWKI